MGTKIRLTESELINLIEKIIKEQLEFNNVFEEYMIAIEQVSNEFDRETTEEDFDDIISEIEHIVDSAVKDDELSDNQIEELHDFANDILRELEFEFKISRDLNEGTKAKKPRPMRSRRSGIKKSELIKSNQKVLKQVS